jgi:hypothetical protein
MSMHTTRLNRTNCRMPLVEPIEAKELVSSNNAQPAPKGKRDVKYFLRLICVA